MRTYRIVFSIALGMICCGRPGGLYGQPRDMDDARFALPETGVPALRKERREKPETRRLKREVKYVAGKDNAWFTADDRVYLYYPVQYDKEGRMIRKSSYGVGQDKRAFTKDDVPGEYQVFQYDDAGRVSKEITYDGKKKKLFYAVPEYDSLGKKIKAGRFDAAGKDAGVTEYRYGRDGVLEQDVVYAGGEVVKYHRFSHDHDKQYGRVLEFAAEDNAQGPDGKWFTGDDAVSSAKECFYNPDGTKASEKKYIEPGPDKLWFTRDDVMQYYTVFEYESAGGHR